MTDVKECLRCSKKEHPEQGGKYGFICWRCTHIEMNEKAMSEILHKLNQLISKLDDLYNIGKCD
ncbi:MAG: hypothetical protein GY861_08285 [bacterium]|nr:hypothetical protein [bacterium]